MSESQVQNRPAIVDGITSYHGNRGGETRDGVQEPPNQHLLYLTACLIGQLVEVQVKNGSIYSGVFHTASPERDYGIVLKIARLARNGLSRDKNDSTKDSTKRPVKTLLIQAKDLVQINAKDVGISAELLQNGRLRENQAEILTDSFLSQSRHGEVERELKPWMPDNDDRKDLGLDSTFQNTWNRNWDQFEINKALFGVESTFDEELYTTKLDKGPQSREREREAWRIAREIEAESTKKVNVSEDKDDIQDFDSLDEESRFASVLRPSVAAESSKPTNFNSCDIEEPLRFSQLAATASTRGTGPDSCDESEGRDFNKSDSNKCSDVELLSSSIDTKVPIINKEKLLPTVVEESTKRVMKVGGHLSPVKCMGVGDATSIQALNLDPGYSQVTEEVLRDFKEFKQQENAKRGKKQREDQVNALKSFSESLKDLSVKPQAPVLVGGNRKMAVVQTSSAFSLPLSTNMGNLNTVVGAEAASMLTSRRSVSSASSEGLVRVSSNDMDTLAEFSQNEALVNQSLTLHSSETANVSLNSIPSTTAPSSPTSSSGVSTGGDSFRRSTRTSNAKEFKLNPHAKSFTPTFAPPRPPPTVQAPVYLTGATTPTAQMSNITSGVGASSMLQPGAQSAAKYTAYNPVALAPVPSGSNPYLSSPATYMPGAALTGATVSPAMGAGQSAIKVPPQLQQPTLAGQTYGPQQPICYTSQSPAVQPTVTYVHPNGQMYSQQMMFGQPGQVVYIQPYTQASPIPPPQSAQSSVLQPKHRGAGVQGVQLCVGPTFIAGPQHFLTPVQVPQVSNNPLQPTSGMLVPTTMSAMQPSQGVIGAMVNPSQQNAGTNMVRVNGKFVGVNYHQGANV